ncbi:hypothetical protein EMIHUDRAFT_449195 [Emiliania huxleyi CCMP1516]|uniref:Uncharacterized protein n=2 Tax=Emiliania huxleyi TaxID=2903 RepID=A0A0D3KI05_EMIH1|nr:hypothetical protein EMIHUDRAFT_449195 [Emiliania huxleyi CCMP1516]EOD35390.1 hypothetical protein EMIHUDRAFT_449195 [Emiliania huxleyi CCMP1516]|eukprot:XP_005787819.1 hypothetical protein EMIHUDRAFT_449195 [Emiliania huxleyi CCMP1516]
MLAATLLLSAPALTPSVPGAGRRAVLAGASSILASKLATSAAVAYDEIPVATADFAEAEKKRKAREDLIKKETALLQPYVKAIEKAQSAEEFEKAADSFALYIIGQGKITDGVKVKELASRIRAAYETLPQFGYRRAPCPKGEEKRDGMPCHSPGGRVRADLSRRGLCYTPGPGAELAFQGLMKQMRKYSMIQLGDFRKVEYAAF